MKTAFKALSGRLRHTALLPAAAILLAGLFAYSNSFRNSFQFDDGYAILLNRHITGALNFGAIWQFWPTRFLPFLSIALNYRLGGADVFGYHAVNVLLHAGTAILVWRLALLTMRAPGLRGDTITAHAGAVSFLAACFFLLHPLQTQAVNYIVQRSTVMAAFFYIASLTLYAAARLDREGAMPGRSAWPAYYICSLLCALAAMFCKEMAVSLPLAICLYEFCFFKRQGRRSWPYILPFTAIVAIMPLTAIATKSVDIIEMRRITESPTPISARRYLLTQFRVMVTYIRLLFIPINQNVDYDYAISNSLFRVRVLFSLGFLAAVLSAAVMLFKRYRLLSFGILWFFITLLPESSVFPIKDVIVEHRLYLPTAGFGIFIACGLYYLIGEKRFRTMAVVCSLLIAAYAVMTFQRNEVWKDRLTLWDDAVRKSPRKDRAYHNRGNGYFDRGDYKRAIADYTRSIAIYPQYAKAFFNRGLANDRLGNIEEALMDYNAAIEIDPKYPDALSMRGAFYTSQGEPGLAIADLSRAIEIDPFDAAAYSNRAAAYFQMREYEKCLADIRKAQSLGYQVDPQLIRELKSRQEGAD